MRASYSIRASMWSSGSGKPASGSCIETSGIRAPLHRSESGKVARGLQPVRLEDLGHGPGRLDAAHDGAAPGDGRGGEEGAPSEEQAARVRKQMTGGELARDMSRERPRGRSRRFRGVTPPLYVG